MEDYKNAQYLNNQKKKPQPQEFDSDPDRLKITDVLKNIKDVGGTAIGGFWEGLTKGDQARTYTQKQIDELRKLKGLPPVKRHRKNWFQRLF